MGVLFTLVREGLTASNQGSDLRVACAPKHGEMQAIAFPLRSVQGEPSALLPPFSVHSSVALGGAHFASMGLLSRPKGVLRTAAVLETRLKHAFGTQLRLSMYCVFHASIANSSLTRQLDEGITPKKH